MGAPKPTHYAQHEGRTAIPAAPRLPTEPTAEQVEESEAKLAMAWIQLHGREPVTRGTATERPARRSR